MEMNVPCIANLVFVSEVLVDGWYFFLARADDCRLLICLLKGNHLQCRGFFLFSKINGHGNNLKTLIGKNILKSYFHKRKTDAFSLTYYIMILT